MESGRWHKLEAMSYMSLATLKFVSIFVVLTWLSTRFAARFSTSSCAFATCFRHTRFRLFLSKTWSRTCCINLDVRSSLGFKQVCSWLSTCFRHAFDLLATYFRHAHASRKPGLQLARIMECGLYGVAGQSAALSRRVTRLVC